MDKIFLGSQCKGTALSTPDLLTLDPTTNPLGVTEPLYNRHARPRSKGSQSDGPGPTNSPHQRCASSCEPLTTTVFKSPTGPPDITAMDLTPDDLKRNYSTDNIWNPQIQPLPPMPQMSGFGRYRHSVEADPQWRLERLDKNLRDLRGTGVFDLDAGPPVGLDRVTWDQYKDHHSRATSFTSSESSDSDGATAAATHYLDKDGTRISRGFHPSAASSANSSYKDGLGSYRRDNSLCPPLMAGRAPEGDLRFGRKGTRPLPLTQSGQRSSRHASASSIPALTAINEIYDEGRDVIRKYEGPCEVHETGNTESALASDDEEEEGEDHGWTDMVIGGGRQVSNLTRQLQRTSTYQKDTAARPKPLRRRTTSDERHAAFTTKETMTEKRRPIRTASRVSCRRIAHKRPESKKHLLEPTAPA